MTFNTQHCKNYITGRIDFSIMADAIKNCGADIPAILTSDHRSYVAEII